MSLNSKKQSLQQNNFFTNIADVDFDSIDFSEFINIKYKSGTKFIFQNNESNEFYLIISGIVDILKTTDSGTDLIIFSRNAGDFVGESSLIANSRRSADVVAKTDVELIKIDKKIAQKLISKLPVLKDNLLRIISDRYKESDKKTASEIEKSQLLEAMNREIISNQKQMKKINSDLENTLKSLNENQKKVIELERKNSVLATAVTVNHEINQHLMVIEGRIELLKFTNDATFKSADFAKGYKKIINAVHEISAIIKKLERVEDIKFKQYSNDVKMVDLGE